MITNRKRETDRKTEEDREGNRMSTNKYGGSGGFRKAPFCNHHSKDQFRQQPAIYAKCKVGGGQQTIFAWF